LAIEKGQMRFKLLQAIIIRSILAHLVARVEVRFA
jgi:hypothetical protein